MRTRREVKNYETERAMMTQYYVNQIKEVKIDGISMSLYSFDGHLYGSRCVAELEAYKKADSMMTR